MDTVIERTDLIRYMRARAPDSSLAHPARALLGTYLDAAADCAWPLAPPERLDAADLAMRLTRVLSVPVNEVRFVSLSQPYADMAWATGEGVARLLDEGLSAGLDASVEDDLVRTYWGALQVSLERRLLRGLGEARLGILERDVRTKLMGGLRQALFSTLAGPLAVRRVEQCADAVEDTLRAFLGMTVLDDRFDGVALGHVVRCMTRAIPLGAKRDEPGVWIALAA